MSAASDIREGIRLLRRGLQDRQIEFVAITVRHNSGRALDRLAFVFRDLDLDDDGGASLLEPTINMTLFGVAIREDKPNG